MQSVAAGTLRGRTAAFYWTLVQRHRCTSARRGRRLAVLRRRLALSRPRDAERPYRRARPFPIIAGLRRRSIRAARWL